MDSIPRCIHFVWLGSNVPLKYIYNINNVAIHNPDFIIYVWLDDTSKWTFLRTLFANQLMSLFAQF